MTQAQDDVARSASPELTERTEHDAADPATLTAAQCSTRAAGSKPERSDWSKVRWVRGGVPFVVGGLIEFCITALTPQFRWGVPVGILATFVCAWGLLDLLGSFDDPDDTVAHRVSMGALWPSLAAVGGTLLLTLALIGLAVAGRLSWMVAAVVIPAAFLGLVVSVYATGQRLGPWSMQGAAEPRRMHERHGFWVVALGTLLYLPMLGSYSLSDPWETHYGEVAREILARNDWISTWWAQDGWFWSKPVLNFWAEALSMALFGVGYQPDRMLIAATHGREPWPEWAIRMPVFIFTVVALYLVYKAVASVFGRRAGLIGAVVLATMPQWFFVAHQTMTDLPFVAAMTSAMALLLLGLHTDPEKRIRTFELAVAGTSFRLSAYHLVFGALLVSVIPQVLYLATRNVELMIGGPWGFRPHADVFFSGSAVNCGLPGNEPCAQTLPANKDMWPAFQALLWVGTTGWLLWLNRRERRLSRLFFMAAWYFAALSTMAKGPAGFVLPALCAGAYIFASGKWRKLVELEFMSGLLVILSVALPWYVAMYMRHGQPFTDRLLFHDMWKRAIVHVHDTNVGVDVSFRYYVWQLGYALFPWTGLVPAGLLWWLRRREDAAGSGRGDVSVFLIMWFVFAFALFTAMLTKFHHYILPAVPPAAMLTGIVLDRMIGERRLAKPGAFWKYLAMLGTGTLLALYGFFRLFPGMLSGFKPEGAETRPGMPALGFPLLLLGMLVIATGVRVFGDRDHDPEPSDGRDKKQPEAFDNCGAPQPAPDARSLLQLSQRERFEDLLLGASGLAAAVVVAAVGYDLASTPDRSSTGQATLLYLFTYNYKRAWPDSLDFSGALAAFTLVAIGLMVLLIARKYRHHVVVLSLMMGFAWALWGLDIYMVKTAPHWGQREIALAYYQDREGPEQPLVAYQMNWKGENFYAGNRVHAFVSSGSKFKSWLEDQKKKGVQTFYFVSEHGRSRSLQNELGNVGSFKKITDTPLNNKFAIFKVTFGPTDPTEPASDAANAFEED
ncbi:MAG: glycosyltransferase family 39 protein [Polyangiaceae bacterium]|nr:glycosyltransferase family 39 protein [Polyangiaceae bacterium]